MAEESTKRQEMSNESSIIPESIEGRILRIQRAIRISVYVVRAFVKLREILLSNKEFAERLKQLELKYEKHDVMIHSLNNTLRRLMAPHGVKDRRQIGFTPDED